MDVPSVFRSLNERILEGAVNGRLELVCECGNERCTERLVMATDAFRSIRGRPRCFVVRPGHAGDGRVVARDEGYLIVER